MILEETKTNEKVNSRAMDTFMESLYNLDKYVGIDNSFIVGAVDITVSPSKSSESSDNLKKPIRFILHTRLEQDNDFINVSKTRDVITKGKLFDHYSDKMIERPEDIFDLCNNNPDLAEVDSDYNELFDRTKVFSVCKTHSKNIGVFDICYCFLEDMYNRGLLTSQLAKEIETIVLTFLGCTGKYAGGVSYKTYIVGNNILKPNANDLYHLLKQQVTAESSNNLEFRGVNSADYKLSPIDFLYVLSNFYNKLDVVTS